MKRLLLPQALAPVEQAKPGTSATPDTSKAAPAAGYCYRLCLSRQPKVLLDGLDSGVAYAVECAAWNDTGALQWSTPVFRIVQ